MQPFRRDQLDPESINRTEAAIRTEYALNPKKFNRKWGYPTGYTVEQVLSDMANLRRCDYEIWTNDKYQVNVSKAHIHHDQWPAMIHLSIKRRDKEPIHDWRDLQEIKNELVGREHEAFELYPAQSRVVDTANQYHIYVFKDKDIKIPVGFTHGIRDDTAGWGGSKQRAFTQ